jgi:hypothetical protein
MEGENRPAWTGRVAVSLPNRSGSSARWDVVS